MDVPGTEQQTAETVLQAAISEPESFDSERLTHVLKLLESRDQTVRLTASWAIGLVVGANPQAVSGSVRALASLLETEPTSTHEDIYRALGYVSTHYPELVREAVDKLDLADDAHEKRIISAIDGYEPSGDGNVVSSAGKATEYEGLGTVTTSDETTNNSPEQATQRGRPPTEAPPTPPVVDARREAFDPVASRGSGSHVELWKVTYETDTGTHTALLKQFRHRAPAEFDAAFTETVDEWQSVDGHDAVVPVVSHGTIPKPWVAVEYQEGRRLSERIGSISRREARWLIDRIVEAVCHAHSSGVIHGGLTPRNVIFSRSYEDAWNYPKVTNWGISQLLCDLTALPMGVPPTYAAPEQVATDEFGGVDASTDIYHLGQIIYGILAGRPPFVGQPGAVMKKTVEESPLPPSHFNDALTDSVDTVVAKSLRKSKLYRYNTVQDFQAELRQALSGGRQ